MQPIYKPSGKALEYCDLALNIYTGCNHGCTYCYAAKMAKRWGKDFTDVQPRKGLVEALKKQLASEKLTGQRIHLCFTCDPYPALINTTVTREVIKAIKGSGNHVQILTKGGLRASRDLDLLDANDWFGVTIAGMPDLDDVAQEPFAAPEQDRLSVLAAAKAKGITTWVSCEPVLNAFAVLQLILGADYIDHFAIGKLNYAPSGINWRAFGQEAERLCKEQGRSYLIKDGLRAEMEARQ